MPEGRLVGIVDYDSGNIRSVVNAVESVGAGARLVRGVQDIDGCSHLLLPGVGAFAFCAERLRASGLVDDLGRWVLEQQRPLLGICVGMQLMADYSEEQGRHSGLGWIGGEVRRLQRPVDDPSIRVPHAGWNEVLFGADFGEFRAGESADFYFDHSYAYFAPRFGVEIGSARHGQTFSAIIRRGNLVAAQFHPEKSQAAGARLLRSFLALQ